MASLVLGLLRLAALAGGAAASASFGVIASVSFVGLSVAWGVVMVVRLWCLFSYG